MGGVINDTFLDRLHHHHPERHRKYKNETKNIKNTSLVHASHITIQKKKEVAKNAPSKHRVCQLPRHAHADIGETHTRWLFIHPHYSYSICPSPTSTTPYILQVGKKVERKKNAHENSKNDPEHFKGRRCLEPYGVEKYTSGVLHSG